MHIHVILNYHTNPGENVFLCGSLPEFGNNNVKKAIPLQYQDTNTWFLDNQIAAPCCDFSYFFLIIKDGQVIRRECARHTHRALTDVQSAWFLEIWEPSHYAPVFDNIKPKSSGKGPVCLRTHCYNVPQGWHVALTGNSADMGNWDGSKALSLHPQGNGIWEVRLPGNILADRPLPYKFILRQDTDHQVYKWEEGGNRWFDTHNGSITANKNELVFINTIPVNCDFFALPHYAGTAIPVFSLRSTKSWGIGDFQDLKKMADWVALTGQRVLQILPVNDTTMYNNWIDSYPYGGISIMALHPLYLHIPAMCPKDAGIDLSSFEKRRKKLNALPKLDYDKVSALKREALQVIYKATGKKVMQEAAFKEFFSENESWLRPYALFCVLRDRFGTADFNQWGKYATYNPEDLDAFTQVKFYYFLQYHLDLQLKDAHKYINHKGLLLKGDIPIGITPRSVEAWTTPDLFKMNSQAGAPPDDFSVNGQNWGFPTYNWELMEQDGYRWWKNRFTHMALYFDAYRIDHILGFFRIWSIPRTQTQGLLGHFDPALPFSQDEIRHYGLPFDYERMVKPYITKDLLVQRFADQWEFVANTFLNKDSWGNFYSLKPEFDNQRKITDYFEQHQTDSKDCPNTLTTTLKEALLSLPAEVLFVADSAREDLFHPRISAQFSYSYQCLDSSQKDAYNRLYDYFFYHRHNDFWYQQAMKKLPELVGATQMLCCAEDLGMIPSCVPSVMENLSLLSLEVQRMPKDPTVKFGNPAQYPYLSVCTTGSHDTSTLREWWEEDRNLSREYYNQFLHRNGEAPYYCEPDVCQQIICAHLDSPSLLCVLPWQDWTSIDGSLRYEKPQEERINVPAIVPHYWRWRMHLTLESLLKEDSFNQKVRQLITNSGRSE